MRCESFERHVPSTRVANSLTTPTFSRSAFCALATLGGILRSLRLFLLPYSGLSEGVDTDR